MLGLAGMIHLGDLAQLFVGAIRPWSSKSRTRGLALSMQGSGTHIGVWVGVPPASPRAPVDAELHNRLQEVLRLPRVTWIRCTPVRLRRGLAAPFPCDV